MPPVTALYDTLGKDYSARRRPDARIAAAINRAIGDAPSIANIGAGTGSYEMPARVVVAIEPSMTMIRQRPIGAAPALQAAAEQIPLRNRCVSVSTAFLTVHHWLDIPRGLGEMRRIARDRVVLLTWDPDGPAFWLTQEYFPTIVRRDRGRFPGLAELCRHLGDVSVVPVMIPADCTDGFLGAFWARPGAYLDPAVRSAMSGFLDVPELDEGQRRLRADLESGAWHDRFGKIARRDALDIGYRIVTARAGNG